MPIHFFEPVPSHFDIISRNVNANHLPNVYGWSSAVGSYDDTAIFYQNLTHATCGSLITPRTEANAISTLEVPITTFAHFAEAHHIHNACVKVDIEGAEKQFIEGAIGALDRITFLIMEVLDSKSSFLTYMTKELGYNVYHIKNHSLTYCPDGTDEYTHNQWNWLFCHKTPDELRSCLATSKLDVVEP